MNRLSGIILILVVSLSVGSRRSAGIPGGSTIGNIYYVSPGGSNSNSGSFLYPWRTIYKAANSVRAGDTVFLRAGVYHESNIFYTDGSETSPILIAGYPGETAIIDGNTYTIPARASGNALLQVYGDWNTIRDLTVTGSGDQGVTIHGDHDTIERVYSHHNWGWGILMTGNYELTQDSELWSNSMMNENKSLSSGWSGGITCARYPDYCTIRRATSWENWGEGISTFESLHTTIVGNISHDNMTNIYISDTKYALVQGNFAYCTSGNKIGPYVEQNSLQVYEESGVPIPLGPGSTRYPSSDNYFLNNISMGCDNNLFATQNQAANNLYAFNTFVNSVGTRVGYNANVQFLTGAAPDQRFINNLVYQSDSIAILQVDQPGIISFSHNLWSKSPPSSFKALGLGDVVGDPHLAMTGSPYSPGWYSLTVGSPAVNAGIVMAETAVDFYGHPRGALPDLGAFEYGIPPAAWIYFPCILK